MLVARIICAGSCGWKVCTTARSAFLAALIGELADLAGSCDVLGIIVADVDDSLGAVLRTAEMGPDRPLAITLITPKGTDADRVTVVERFETACGEAAEGAPLHAMAVSPTFDIDGHGDGIITRDRERERFCGRILRSRSAVTSASWSSSLTSSTASHTKAPTATTRWRSAGTTPSESSPAGGWRIISASPSATGTRSPGTASTSSGPARSIARGTRRSRRYADPMDAAKQKMDAAFQFFSKLGVPFYCFHDRYIAPEGASFKESAAQLDEMVDAAAAHQQRTGVQLLWGTANLFSNPRFQAGAATNPDPEVFAYAAGQVAHCLEATHRLGGHNYVLWGGREEYETLLNTDMKRELDQLARFMSMVVVARALLAAASIVESGELDHVRDPRYAGWSGPFGTSIMAGTTLDDLHDRALTTGEPSPTSGHQEKLENLVARHIERAR